MASEADRREGPGGGGGAGLNGGAPPIARRSWTDTSGATTTTPRNHDDEAAQPSDGEEDRDNVDDPSSSSLIASPSSITSPPYWSSSRGHQRSISNMSSESALPAGAITLRDNETNDRNTACWAKSVEVLGHTVVNGSATNIGAFVVWTIRVETLSGSYMNIRKRYSEFDDFRNQLVSSFPNYEAAVPSLPPKSVISKFRPRFLEKRRAGLQYFLNCILLNPEFSGSPVLKEFLFA